MTQRATTSLSLHYQVKPGQREQVLVEIKGMLDRCAKEPEFIMAINKVGIEWNSPILEWGTNLTGLNQS